MSSQKKKKFSSSAEVVDKHLILSLPNASEPIVWRMELETIGTASFEISKDKAKKSYKLMLKPKKGSAEVIAPFTEEDDAITALMQASEAMQRPATNTASTQNINTPVMNPVPNATQQQSTQFSKKWMYLLLGFIAAIGLYVFMTKQTPKTNNFDTSTKNSLSSESDSKTGVPMSADDFLNNL
jgi:hypothetical protein